MSAPTKKLLVCSAVTPPGPQSTLAALDKNEINKRCIEEKPFKDRHASSRVVRGLPALLPSLASPSTHFYFPQPARMAWWDWKKPGKVMLFDFSASSNYILAFITK